MVEVKVISKLEEKEEAAFNVLSQVSSTWAIPVILRLGYFEVLRYNQLKNTLKNVSSRSLSRTLSSLVSSGIVSREVRNGSPPQVFYSLTERGTELAELMDHMSELGDKWNSSAPDSETIEVSVAGSPPV